MTIHFLFSISIWFWFLLGFDLISSQRKPRINLVLTVEVQVWDASVSVSLCLGKRKEKVNEFLSADDVAKSLHEIMVSVTDRPIDRKDFQWKLTLKSLEKRSISRFKYVISYLAGLPDALRKQRWNLKCWFCFFKTPDKKNCASVWGLTWFIYSVCVHMCKYFPVLRTHRLCFITSTFLLNSLP